MSRNAHTFHHPEKNVTTAGVQLIRMSGRILRLSILAILTVLEPVIRTVLAGLALLGIFMALFFKYLLNVPQFPFWIVMGIAGASAVLLMGYYGVMRWLSNR